MDYFSLKKEKPLKTSARNIKENIFKVLSFITMSLSVVVLAVLFYHILKTGYDWVDLQFLESYPSRHPQKAGIKAGIWGTFWLISLTALFLFL